MARFLVQFSDKSYGVVKAKSFRQAQRIAEDALDEMREWAYPCPMGVRIVRQLGTGESPKTRWGVIS